MTDKNHHKERQRTWGEIEDELARRAKKDKDAAFLITWLFGGHSRGGWAPNIPILWIIIVVLFIIITYA
jgi:hypothetical protein